MKTFIKDLVAISLVVLGLTYAEPTGAAIMLLSGVILLAVTISDYKSKE